MSDECKMMYTAQADIVLDTLARDGVYYVKKSYVQQKYRETAWIFREAYDYLQKARTQKQKDYNSINYARGSDSKDIWKCF